MCSAKTARIRAAPIATDVVTRDEVILCPECAAACKEGCDKMRAIGCGSCALFADEDDEGQGWCELHQESVCYADKCANRISKV